MSKSIDHLCDHVLKHNVDGKKLLKMLGDRTMIHVFLDECTDKSVSQRLINMLSLTKLLDRIRNEVVDGNSLTFNGLTLQQAFDLHKSIMCDICS